MTRWTYSQTIQNPKTDEEVTITGSTEEIVRQRIARKLVQWRNQNEKLELKECKERTRQQVLDSTENIRTELNHYHLILSDALKTNQKLNWTSLENHATFPKFKAGPIPNKDQFFNQVPKKSFFEFLESVKNKRLEAEERAQLAYDELLEEFKKSEDERLKKYKKEQQAFIKKQQKDNSIVKKLKQQYENNEEDAVAEYTCLILERSQYPASLYKKMFWAVKSIMIKSHHWL